MQREKRKASKGVADLLADQSEDFEDEVRAPKVPKKSDKVERVRVWWPPTKDKERTGFSGAYWPATVLKKGTNYLTVEYDNGEHEKVDPDNIFPYDVPIEFGKEAVPLVVGEFVEVSNNSKTDPCAWLGKIASVGKKCLIDYPFHDSPSEYIKQELLRRGRVWDDTDWKYIELGQKWKAGEVTSPIELNLSTEEEYYKSLKAAGGGSKAAKGAKRAAADAASEDAASDDEEAGSSQEQEEEQEEPQPKKQRGRPRKSQHPSRAPVDDVTNGRGSKEDEKPKGAKKRKPAAVRQAPTQEEVERHVDMQQQKRKRGRPCKDAAANGSSVDQKAAQAKEADSVAATAEADTREDAVPQAIEQEAAAKVNAAAPSGEKVVAVAAKAGPATEPAAAEQAGAVATSTAAAMGAAEAAAAAEAKSGAAPAAAPGSGEAAAKSAAPAAASKSGAAPGIAASPVTIAELMQSIHQPLMLVPAPNGGAQPEMYLLPPGTTPANAAAQAAAMGLYSAGTPGVALAGQGSGSVAGVRSHNSQPSAAAATPSAYLSPAVTAAQVLGLPPGTSAAAATAELESQLALLDLTAARLSLAKMYTAEAYLLLVDCWRSDSARLADALRSFKANVLNAPQPDYQAFMVGIFGMDKMKSLELSSRQR